MGRDDRPAILDLARANLADYQPYQATLWRRASGAGEQQAAFLASRLDDQRVSGYLHDVGGAVDGFIFANVVAAPPVYDPGGPRDWTTAGAALLDASTRAVREQGAVLAAVVAGHDDTGKHALLERAGYFPASEWHLRRLDADPPAARVEEGTRRAEVRDLPPLLHLAEQRRVQ